MAYWKDPSVIGAWLWVGICLILLFVSFIIWITQNYISNIKKEKDKRRLLLAQSKHKLLATGISVQEDERKRIANNLHDNLISQLNLIRLSDPIVLDNKDLSTKIKHCMGIARRISHDLLPPFIQNMSLYEIVKDHCDSLPDNYNVDFIFKPTNETLKAVEKLQLLRIIQEVSNNIFKHAKANEIQVHLRLTNKSLALKIKDNGVGIKEEKKGLGLQSIDSRAKLLKARYKFYSRENLGTTFILHMELA